MATSEDVEDLREAAAQLDDAAVILFRGVHRSFHPERRRNLARKIAAKAAELDAEVDRLEAERHQDRHPPPAEGDADPGPAGGDDPGTSCPPGRSE